LYAEETAGPSTAPLAMKLREAPLRMTLSIAIQDDTFSINQSLTLRVYVDTALADEGLLGRRRGRVRRAQDEHVRGVVAERDTFFFEGKDDAAA
jgi:hypothetical protein